MIPRKVIQLFPTSELPDALAEARDRMIAGNPEWTFTLFDHADAEDFIRHHYGLDLLAKYLRIAPEYGAARADLFRYLAVSATGGVYIDAKSYFSEPLDSVILPTDEFVLSQWRNGPGQKHEGFGLHADLRDVSGGEFQQWHVISRPGHPFLDAVIECVLANIDRYSPWTFGVGRAGVQRLSGPIAYTKAIVPLLGMASYRRVANEAALGLHFSVEGEYHHLQFFPKHYSLHTTPIVRLPVYRQPSVWAYRVVRKLAKAL